MTAAGGDQLRAWRAGVISRYPHPGRGFTQGLLAGTGSAGEIAVWESTGPYGQSALCRYRLGHLQPQRRAWTRRYSAAASARPGDTSSPAMAAAS